MQCLHYIVAAAYIVQFNDRTCQPDDNESRVPEGVFYLIQWTTQDIFCTEQKLNNVEHINIFFVSKYLQNYMLSQSFVFNILMQFKYLVSM